MSTAGKKDFGEIDLGNLNLDVLSSPTIPEKTHKKTKSTSMNNGAVIQTDAPQTVRQFVRARAKTAIEPKSLRTFSLPDATLTRLEKFVYEAKARGRKTNLSQVLTDALERHLDRLEKANKM